MWRALLHAPHCTFRSQAIAAPVQSPTFSSRGGVGRIADAAEVRWRDRNLSISEGTVTKALAGIGLKCSNRHISVVGG